MGSTYRCQGCREYRPMPSHAKFGLGHVCSDDCKKLAADRSRSKKTKTAKPMRTTVSAGRDVPALARVTVMQRDRGKCRFCGTATNLHLHHVIYRSHGVDHQPHNLIALCDEHHALVHSEKRRWAPVLLAYIWYSIVEDKRYLIPLLEKKLKAEGFV